MNGLINENLDVITHAVTLIIKAAIMAARFSGSVRKRSLKRLAAMDADTKDKEILFLKDKIYQLEMQVFTDTYLNILFQRAIIGITLFFSGPMPA